MIFEAKITTTKQNRLLVFDAQNSFLGTVIILKKNTAKKHIDRKRLTNTTLEKDNCCCYFHVRWNPRVGTVGKIYIVTQHYYSLLNH